jgi:DNA-binding transcriptional MerR regulator
MGARAEREIPGGPPARHESTMSIGEVLARLRPEFPDVTISKLRFLESEGLVEPRRAPSGYRKYSGEDLDRLRFVLAAQRDRYLPLRVIREHLAAQDRGDRVLGPGPADRVAVAGSSPTVSPAPRSPGAGSALPSPPISVFPTPTGLTPTGLTPTGPSSTGAGAGGSAGVVARAEVGDVRLTRAQLAERSGLDEAGVADLERYGLLTPQPSGYYSGEALTVARIAGALAEYGLEARHLRPYRATADREVGLLSQLVLPIARHGGLGGRQAALEAVHELATLGAQLHGALVRQGLREALGA